MLDKFDYKSIRIFPYTIGIALFSILVSVLAFDCSAALNDVIIDGGFYDVTNKTFMVARAVEYVSIAGIFFCLYQFIEIDKWFRCAYISFVFFFFSEMFKPVLQWLADTIKEEYVIPVVINIFTIVPEICILAGLYFILLSVSFVYKKIDMKNMADKCDKVNKLWLFAQVQFGIVGLLLVSFLSISNGIVKIIVSAFMVVATFVFVLSIVRVLKTVFEFCFQIYLYNYNNR